VLPTTPPFPSGVSVWTTRLLSSHLPDPFGKARPSKATHFAALVPPTGPQNSFFLVGPHILCLHGLSAIAAPLPLVCFLPSPDRGAVLSLSEKPFCISLEQVWPFSRRFGQRSRLVWLSAPQNQTFFNLERVLVPSAFLLSKIARSPLRRVSFPVSWRAPPHRLPARSFSKTISSKSAVFLGKVCPFLFLPPTRRAGFLCASRVLSFSLFPTLD